MLKCKKCKCGRFIYDFEAAVDRMPVCLLFDAWTMKTLADLASVAETEIENYLGGHNLCDAPDIKTKRQFNQVKNYLSAVKHSMNPCH
jgi:hypothetical protein